MSSDTASSRAAPTAQHPARAIAEETPNDVTVAAIRDHHARLAEQLRTHTHTVVSGVYVGNYAAARDTLHHWYCTELMPHIIAEEGALYAPAADLDATRLLIRSMLGEHQVLLALIEDLAFAPGALEAATIAAAAEVVFTSHLRSENDILLPALSHARLDLSSMLAGMHEILGQTRPPQAADDDTPVSSRHAADEITGRQERGRERTGPPTAELDVRDLPHDDRHEVIFGELGRLAPGCSLIIINDHDPKPLRYQVAALWPSSFSWSYLQTGPQLWRVSITRVR